MAELPSPVELLELNEGQSATFRVLRYEKGTLTIKPLHQPGGKTVDALRVYVRPEDKPTFPPYWDLAAATLVAQIEPHLNRPDLPQITFTLTAQGIPPKKRFSVQTTTS